MSDCQDLRRHACSTSFRYPPSHSCLPLGERAAHALFHPAPSARPFLAHALETVDHFGHLAVARSGGAAVECDEGIADQLLVSGSLHPSGAAWSGDRGTWPGSPPFPSPLDRAETRNVRRHGSAAGTVTGEPDRQGPLGCADEQMLDITRADDDVPDARLVSQHEARRRPRNGDALRRHRARPCRGSVSQWIGASGAISAGSTKGMEAPAIGGKGKLRHAPDGLARRQMANLGTTGRSPGKVAPVAGIATKGLPRDLFVVQCQDVVVGAEVRRPRRSDRGSSEWHGSPTHAPDTSRVDWWASERIRCRCGDRHEAKPRRIMSPQTFSLRKISRHR